MDLDAALKTQINTALANALQGIKSATLSKEAVVDLVAAGRPLPLLRNRTFHGFMFSRAFPGLIFPGSVVYYRSCHPPAGNPVPARVI